MKSSLKLLAVAGILGAALSAQADARWTRSGNTITDGRWTLNVSAFTYNDHSGIAITTIKTEPSDGHDLDLTGGVSDGSDIIAFNGWTFNQKSYSDKPTFKLPDTLVYVSARALYSAGTSKIEYDFSKLEFVGSRAFNTGGVPTDLKLTNKRLVSIGGESGYSTFGSGLTSVEIPSVTNIGASAFNGCLNLTNVVFSKERVYLQTGAFNGCMSGGNRCHAWFPGKAPICADDGKSDALALFAPAGNGWARRNIHCGYRHDPEGWDAFAAITPMTDADDPPAQRPADCFGVHKANWGTRIVRDWLIAYDGAALAGLEVANDVPTTAGTLSPEAGFYRPADGAVFAATDGATETNRSFCIGWKREILDDDGNVLSADEDSTTTFTYSAADGEYQRLIWRWSNEVAVAVGEYSGGSVSVNGATVAAGGKVWVAEGVGTVGLVATPDAGLFFGGWGPDVPEELRNNLAISLPPDRSWSLKPRFVTKLPWVLSADGRSITDGRWTLNVSAFIYNDHSGVQVTSVKTAPTDGYDLDLTGGVSDGSDIIAIGSMAFNQKKFTGSPTFKLPDTLVYAGDRAFYDAGVGKFEYDFSKLEFVGNRAFNTGGVPTDLKLTNERLVSIGGEVGYSTFGSNLTSIEIPYATNIGAYAFYNCPNLTNVVFSKERVYLQTGAFYQSMNVGDRGHAWFPGKAPVCVDDGKSDALALFAPAAFGWARRNIHCGYRHDPEGWDAFAAITPMTDADDPPASRPPKCFGVHKANWGTRVVRDWLIKYPGYCPPGLMIFLK